MVQAQNMHLVKFKPISLNDATMLTNSVDFTSAIGHQDMARFKPNLKEAPMLTTEEKQKAISWYANNSYDLITIAQHFGIHVEELKQEIRS
ncbi:hypothetical protein I3271_09230 [Photobacterium leiognathi]|uniref:hypothetical protein n=1 Tax=Photobacterium leiognathi TaxID=553611 RepID=UPI001EE1195E|nr:hypothetical protein [Photobacterium leiognathi]